MNLIIGFINGIIVGAFFYSKSGRKKLYGLKSYMQDFIAETYVKIYKKMK